MKKIAKIKNIIVTGILVALTVLGISTTSNAQSYGTAVSTSVDSLKIGDTFSLSYTEYNGSMRLFCIEHGKKLNSKYHTYTVQNIITITKDTATGIVDKKDKNGKVIGTETKEIEATGSADGWNAKLAAGIYYSTSVSDRRNAIWYYTYNWISYVGKNFKNISTSLVNSKNNGLSSTITTKVNNYVKNVKNDDSEEAYIQKVSTKVSASLYELDSKYYEKVGPFKLKFSPDLEEITMKGYKLGNSKEQSITNFKILQSGKIVDIGNLKSNVEFSILIPINQQVYKISSIYVKTKETTPTTFITAKIAYLKTGTGSEAYQNLCIVETDTEDGDSKNYEFNYKLNYTITGNVNVVKVDKKDPNITLPGVGFKLYHKELGLWVKQDKKGNITYVSESNATTFVTNAKGKKYIAGLKLGSYTFVEQFNPNEGYECENKDFKISSNKNGTVKWTMPNEKHTGNVLVEKVDKDNPTIKLGDVGFKLYNEELKLWVKQATDGTITYVDENSATTFVTDKNGEKYISGLQLGKYMFVEQYNNNGDYVIENKEFEVTETTDGYVPWTVPNGMSPGNVLVEKVDKDDPTIKLKDVGFKLYNEEIKLWVKQDKKGNITYVNESSATTFVTDENGEKYIEGLRVGKYKFVEQYNNNGDYVIEDQEFEVTKTKDGYVTWTVPNGKKVGNVLIEKVDKVDPTIKLKDVGFKLYNKELKLWVKQATDGTITYVDENSATTFVTDENGEKYIEGLRFGSYTFAEQYNNNYGYECENKDFEITEKEDGYVTWTVPNPQTLVKLSGYVWVDKISEKQSYKNYLYKDNELDSGDTLLDGITVRLKDKTNDSTVATTKTSNGGKYLFEDVLIEKLGDYYIEFEYDGLTYQNVVANIDKDNGSKAAEASATRTEFNKNFSVVEGSSSTTGYTRDANKNKKYDLSYNVNESDHTATFINNGQFTITALTSETGYSIEEHFTPGLEEIENINLGLYEREQPDIALAKDIQNVRLTINGYEHTYTYAQRFLNAGEYGDGFNVGVKFGLKYGSMSYTRAIYKADYEYINESDESKELKVYVTYQLKMKNESSNLTTQINSIVDYYDSKYDIVSIGTDLDSAGNVTGNIEYTETTYDNNYKKIIINNNTKVGSQEEASIYVQFKLSREQVATILKDKQEGEKADSSNILDNVAEINSYSVYDGNGIYAGIDVNSNPGNCVPGEKNTYEDDTDSSPSLQLEVADAREMTGKVFLDSTSGELMTGEVRQGDGKYTEGETGIAGVEVTLTETTGTGKVYTATTDENGDFYIAGYIPGDYTLTYTWGDSTYTVQNYKGTVYNSNRDQTDKNWYKTDVDTRYTDAIDNYETRKAIDAEIVDTNGEATRTKMDSTTPTMGIGVEYETTYTASSGDRYTYLVKNVDFGIVERARQVLDISKSVSGIKITLANGQIIVNAQIVDGKLQGDTIKGLTYMGPANGDNGFVKAEIDNELIQGAILQVEYEIKVTNNSELDYDSYEYYAYGTQTGDKVTLKPTGVYDYLDNKIILDSSNTNGWEIVSREDYNEKYESDSTIIEKYYKEGKTTQTTDDGTEIEVYKWETGEGNYIEIFTEWTETIETQQKTVTDAKLNNKTILENANLEKALLPGESNPVKIYTSKTLANTDEIELNNDTELAKIERTTTTGRIPDITNSNVYARGETVIITPPTGENQNYIMPIIIGAIALIILGTGVIVIKKKVI